ncbi:hypothetical protein HDE_00854 [Halotydeus destructor]|nr:hypothetical protein HDE_00854 [Halotydeus destructor]
MAPVDNLEESSEQVGAPIVRDVRCPCPDTAAEFEKFIEDHLTSYDDRVSRLTLPEWLLDLQDHDEDSFIGETVLLCYPSLSSVPPDLTYPRLLLEQYSAAESCNWTDFEMPGCIGHNASSFEQFGYPFSLTGRVLLNNVAAKLTKINLAFPSDFCEDYAETFLEKIASGQTPELQTLELNLEGFANEETTDKIKDMRHNLDIVGHLLYYELKDVPVFDGVWASWPAHRSSLTVHCEPPLDEEVVDFVTRFATKLIVEADLVHSKEEESLIQKLLPSTPETSKLKRKVFELVKELEIPQITNPNIDMLMLHLGTMEMPNLEEIEISCLATLPELPKILLTSHCKPLLRFKAHQIRGLTSRKPPALTEHFKNKIRSMMLTKSQEKGQNFVDWEEPFDLDPNFAHDADGFFTNDGISASTQPSIPPRMTRRKLREDSATQNSKLLLRNTLWCLAETGAESLVTAELSFYNIGGFTSAICKFLLVMLKRSCDSLKVLPVSLEGGLHIQMMPVVFALCRNWDKVAFSFWCPFESFEDAMEITRKTISLEADKHSAIEIIVDCEEATVFGEVVNGLKKLVLRKGEDNRFTFGETKIPRKITATLLRPTIPFVQRRSIEIAEMVKKEIAGLAGLFSDFTCENLHNACDLRKFSDETISRLVKRMAYFDSLEQDVADRILTVLRQ